MDALGVSGMESSRTAAAEALATAPDSDGAEETDEPLEVGELRAAAAGGGAMLLPALRRSMMGIESNTSLSTLTMDWAARTVAPVPGLGADKGGLSRAWAGHGQARAGALPDLEGWSLRGVLGGALLRQFPDLLWYGQLLGVLGQLEALLPTHEANDLLRCPAARVSQPSASRPSTTAPPPTHRDSPVLVRDLSGHEFPYDHVKGEHI